MNQNFYKIGLFAVVLLLLAFALFNYRPQKNNLTRITVVGNSKAKIAPDTALITFSVVTQNSQALNAQQENAKKSEAVKQAIQQATENMETELRTDNYNLSPEEDYSGKTPKISGYEVRNTVTVSISDLTKVGAVIDAATKAGVNSVEGIKFVLGETSPAQGNALSLATKQALAKAEAIAKSLNGKIVRVVESREFDAPVMNENLYSSNTMAVANMSPVKPMYSTPVQEGSLDVFSQVVLVVEIEV